MSNLKLLRTRIKSVKSTQKITKAMQLVSATKFTRAKNQVKNSEDYINIFHNIMVNLTSENNLQDMGEKERKFFSEDLTDNVHLLIIITSERGLCGALNFLLIHQIKSDIAKLKELNKDIKLIIIGRKGYNALKGEYLNYIDSFYDFPKPNDNNLSLIIREKIIKLFENSEISNCQIYFNKCKNAMVQIPTKQQILPVKQQTKLEQDKYLSYKYEGKDLVFNMINLYINSQINYALLHNRASEEGTRMTAMDDATNNANDIIDKLTLKLNKSRQNLITKDLIEIIAGAEAL
ncbi:MAG: ATP synthase F1 subunit gamma [Candidatus Rickettsia vulgarisii]